MVTWWTLKIGIMLLIIFVQMLDFTLVKMMIFNCLRGGCLYLFLLRLSCWRLSRWHETNRLILFLLECDITRSYFEHSWWNNQICCLWLLLSLFFLQKLLVQFWSLYLIKVTSCSRYWCRILLDIYGNILDTFLEFEIRFIMVLSQFWTFHKLLTFEAKLQFLSSQRRLISVIALHVFILRIAAIWIRRCIEPPPQLQAHLPEFKSHRVAIVLIVLVLLVLSESCRLSPFFLGFGNSRRGLSVDPAVFTVGRTTKMLSKIVVICIGHIELLFMVIYFVIFTLVLSFNN